MLDISPLQLQYTIYNLQYTIKITICNIQITIYNYNNAERVMGSFFNAFDLYSLSLLIYIHIFHLFVTFSII